MAWSNVCKPVLNGGLGIKDLDAFSRALRLRWLWFAWDDRDRPWKDLQLPNDNGDCKLFHAATRVQLGNGRRAAFWKSRWLHGDAPADLFPVLFSHSKRKNRSVADALANDAWVRDVDHNMTQTVIAEYVQLWEKLQTITLSQSQTDSISWVSSADGQYSARSAYLLQFQGLPKCDVAITLWKTKAPPKCKFFCWLLIQDRVWTAARLQVRQWPNEYFCQLCVRNLETANHLFLECPVTRSIWDRVGIWLQAPSLQPAHWDTSEDVKDWLLQIIRKFPSSCKKGVRALILLIIWEIWKERNNRVFRKVSR